MGYEAAVSFTAADLDTVARTLWGEARSEGQAGMEAVASVIVNRVRRPGVWGRSPRGCCVAKDQFSSWHARNPNRLAMVEATRADPQFVMALDIARRALSGALLDTTKGADSFVHHGTAHPSWATPERWTVRIGRHDFYRVVR